MQDGGTPRPPRRDPKLRQYIKTTASNSTPTLAPCVETNLLTRFAFFCFSHGAPLKIEVRPPAPRTKFLNAHAHRLRCQSNTLNTSIKAKEIDLCPKES